MNVEYARLNSRFTAFYLTRYSPKTGNIVYVGKPYSSIEDALAAAARLDSARQHLPGYRMTFVDVVPPKRKNSKTSQHVDDKGAE